MRSCSKKVFCMLTVLVVFLSSFGTCFGDDKQVVKELIKNIEKLRSIDNAQVTMSAMRDFLVDVRFSLNAEDISEEFKDMLAMAAVHVLSEDANELNEEDRDPNLTKKLDKEIKDLYAYYKKIK